MRTHTLTPCAIDLPQQGGIECSAGKYATATCMVC